MNKGEISISDIVDLMVEGRNISQESAEEYVRVLLSCIEDALIEGDTVKVKGLGTFRAIWNDENSQLKDDNGVGFYQVDFSPEEDWRAKVNEPFAHLEVVTIKEQERKVTPEQEDTEAPLQLFEEQATEIKNLLNEIETLSAKDSNHIIQKTGSKEVVDISIEETNDADKGSSKIKNDKNDFDLDDFQIVRAIYKDHPEIIKEKNLTVHNDAPEEVNIRDKEKRNDSSSREELKEKLKKELREELREELKKELRQEVDSSDQFDGAKEVDIINDSESYAPRLSKELTEELSKESNKKADQGEQYSQQEEGITLTSSIEKEEENIIQGDKITDTPIITSTASEKQETIKVSDDIEDTFKPNYESNRRRPLILRYIIIGLLTLAILGAIIYLQHNIKKDKELEKEEIRIENLADSLAKEERLRELQDSIMKNTNDTSTIRMKKESEGSLITSTSTNQEVFSRARNYIESIGEEKMKPGSQLTRFARDYYGHSDFWIYIYEANKDKIKHPDNLPAGVTLKIPKVDAKLIDKNNPKAIEYAKELQRKYLQH